MTYQPKVYRKQGGDELVVASGGVINVETGGILKANGTQAAFVADVATTGTYATDDDAIVAAINSLKTALVGAGIMAAS
ncbi:hypothetical protein [Mesorhizobium sp.]|uniref:hypothetical protein n=1 Tax=Mesorhizobium sp. TaxID=1871066 RepID=UPI000FE7500A|nr:hypothetical protein [Mesorhizobium sp.]RWO08222.1 MAG: hypothetical protein EOS15_29860 [Mesorhizobium sp.]